MRCPQPIKGWALPCPFLSLSCSLGTLNTTPWWGAAMSFGYPRFLWCTCVPPGTSIHHKCTYIYPRDTFLYKFIQILPLGTRLQFVKRVYRTVERSRKARLWRDELPKPKTGNRIQNSRIFALSTFFVSK